VLHFRQLGLVFWILGSLQESLNEGAELVLIELQFGFKPKAVFTSQVMEESNYECMLNTDPLIHTNFGLRVEGSLFCFTVSV